MKRLVLATIPLVFLLQSCDRGGRTVTNEPSISEIAGRYRLSSSMFGGGVDAEIQSKAKDAYIELNTNGEAIFNKVPVVPDSESRRFTVQEFRSGSGTFLIAPLGGNAKSDFYGVYLSCGELPDPIGHPHFRRKGQALLLSFEYFDGDFTERMVFARTR